MLQNTQVKHLQKKDWGLRRLHDNPSFKYELLPRIPYQSRAGTTVSIAILFFSRGF